MRYLRRSMMLAALISFQVAVSTVFSAGVINNLYTGKFPPGVYVGGQSLAGQTKESFIEADEKTFDRNTGRIFLTFSYGRKSWQIPYASLEATSNWSYILDRAVEEINGGSLSGMTWLLSLLGRPLHLEPGFYFNRELLISRLESISGQVAVAPESAALTLADGKVAISHGRAGKEVDISSVLAALGPELPAGGASMQLPMKSVAPAVTTQQLAALKSLLGSYTTRLSPGEHGRNHNIGLAAKKLNGVLIGPGRVFSLNRYLGPRTEEKGYVKAPAIVDNQLINQTGGGVCQLSTTLYNAALLAGLDIKERYPHTLPVPYIPLGLDSTISWKTYDLKFSNNTGYPLYIASLVVNHQLSVYIFGKRSQPEKISVYTRVIVPDGGSVPPERSLEEAGSAAENGVIVLVYREITGLGGQVTKELISRDYYRVAANLPKYGK